MAEASSHREWLYHLPALDSLASKSTNTLLRPFSRFSISSLFRSFPSLPPLALLQPFLDIGSLDDNGQSNENPPTRQELGKWLLSLREYTSQLKEAVVHHELDRGSKEVQDRIGTLVEAYLGAVYLLGRKILEADDEIVTGSGSNHLAYGKCLKDILRAFFYLRQDIHDYDGSTRLFDQHILGSIFPPDQTKYNRLAPIVAHSRKLIASLQYHPTRPLASSSKLKPTASAASPTTAFFRLNVSDDEVLQALEVLDIFVDGVERADSIPGPIVSKNKKQKEEDNRRPMRVALEAKVLKCDLLLSMTTKNISQVKSRAATRYSAEISVKSDGMKKVDGAEGYHSSSENGDDALDAKPRLSDEGDLECIKDDTVQPRSPLAESFDALQGSKWEDKAEESLVKCLIAAKHLVEEGRSEVLSSELQIIAWLGEEGVVHPKQETADSRQSKSKSPSHNLDLLDQTSESDDDETDFDSDEEDSSEDESTDAGGTSYACPLRTLFRLHDRYEEQRLAVWLHLPSNKREKMGFFMRGEEGGRVGSAWDGFGLALMMEYDSETLMSHGLGTDKLDKWIELAAVKNTKKIKRKNRGRKTV
ncbi:hypothetical protein IAU59_000795 [Kwoniella sp. CBS 9459]